MPPLVANLSIQRTLRKFRLVTASAIVCNGKHTEHPATDICIRKHIIELCDDYAMSLLLHWLATKYGFPAYAMRISSNESTVPAALESWPDLADEYPLANAPLKELSAIAVREAILILDSELPVQLSVLGTLHELVQSEELVIDDEGKVGFSQKPNRKLTGMYYTPDWVVQYCFDQYTDGRSTDVFAAITADASFKLLDPACGTGNFLVGAISWFKKIGLTEPQLMTLCSNSLFGRDVDGKAVSLSRLGIILQLSTEIRSLHENQGQNITADVLQKLILNLRKHVVITDSITESSSNAAAEGQFNLVISNPPYVSYGSRNQLTLSESWTKFLKSSYPASSEYKIRLHSIFQDIALRNLRPNGTAVLLLPDAFLTGQYYSRLRGELLKTCQIHSFTELPDNTIPGATVGRWCVAAYKKALPDNNASVKLFSFDEQPNVQHPQPSKKFELPLNVLVTADRQRFRLLFNRTDCEIWQHLDKLAPLSSQLKGHTGIRGLKGKATIVSETRHDSNWKKGLTKGNSVTRHNVIWDGSWIKIDKTLLYAGGFNSQVIDNPKLIVRQTGDTIIAAFDAAGFYHLNNLHSFSAQTMKPGFAPDLRYFDGLLNSHLWLYLYRSKSREQGKALAQIDIELVESLPLPPDSSQECNLVATLVQTAQHLNLTMSSTSSRQNQAILASKLRFAERAIDRLIYQLYKLPPEHVQYIDGQFRQGIEESLPNMEEIICFSREADNMMTAQRPNTRVEK